MPFLWNDHGDFTFELGNPVRSNGKPQFMTAWGESLHANPYRKRLVSSEFSNPVILGLHAAESDRESALPDDKLLKQRLDLTAGVIGFRDVAIHLKPGQNIFQPAHDTRNVIK